MGVQYMSLRDLPDVCMIDRATFGRNCWGKREFIDVRKNKDVRSVVHKSENGVLNGYALWVEADDQILLLRIGVLPDSHRMGFGGQLVDRVIDRASSGQFTFVECVLFRPVPKAMRRFLRKMGFRKCPSISHTFAKYVYRVGVSRE